MPCPIPKLLLLSVCAARLPAAAETPAIRMSAPTIAWVLSSDGFELIQIAGVPESPRAGQRISLPSVALRAWSSPDAQSAVLRLEDGLYLQRSAGKLERVAELEKDAVASLEWDRLSAGFAACWAQMCQSRVADGALVEQWAVDPGSRIIAYSVQGGAVTASESGSVWRYNRVQIPLEIIPTVAALRPGADELWTVDREGRLTGRDRAGRRTGEGEMISGAIGLVGSLDGASFFAINADREAAFYSVALGRTDRFTLDGDVDGAWAAPGPFAVRLHESAKRPVAIWEGDSGITGWMPGVGR